MLLLAVPFTVSDELWDCLWAIGVFVGRLALMGGARREDSSTTKEAASCFLPFPGHYTAHLGAVATYVRYLLVASAV